jgi:16S rRNA (uracil1498-N3)-methyltransferase
MDAGAAAELRRAAAHQLVADLDALGLDEAAHHHLFRVLRLRDGELVTVTDGAGRWRRCLVAGEQLVADGAVSSASGRPDTTIGVAVPKSDRPEWIVQKLTELGVGTIVFLHTERSVVRWDTERAHRHLARLRKVSIEALQQSRHVWLPTIEGPRPARDLLPDAAAAEPGGRALRDHDRTVLIGPEGGWSDAELAIAGDRVSVGSSVLRVETAAVAVASVMAWSRLAAPS